MSPRTKTRPHNDHSYWRRLLKRVHPDHGGDHDLFVWTKSLQEHFQHGPCALDTGRDVARGPQPTANAAEEPDRIPFDPHLDPIALSRRVLALVDELEHPYSAVLRLLANCGPATHGRPQLQERKGATYRQLAAIAHAAGMSYPERLRWYEVARAVPLSQRQAGHILSRLKSRAA